jgi:hypothetical protein
MYTPPPDWLKRLLVPAFPLLLLQGAWVLLFRKLAGVLPRWLALPLAVLLLPVNLIIMLPTWPAQNVYVWALNSFNAWRNSLRTGFDSDLRNPCWSCGYHVNFKDAYGDSLCPWCGSSVSADVRWTEVTS